MSLPARVRKLEAHFRPQESSEISFEMRLMAFRIMMLNLLSYDARPTERNREKVDWFLEKFSMTEQRFRQYIKQEIPTFELHTSIDHEWSPLNGFSDEIRQRRGYDRVPTW